MKFSRKTVFAIVLLSILTLLFLAGPTMGKNKSGATLDYGLTGKIPKPGFDPAVVVSDVATIILRNVYGRLVEYTPNGNKIEPGLAKDWDISDDHLTYTFHLRKGVTFHDGSVLTAEDVKYSFNRALKIGVGYSWLLDNIAEDGIEAVGKYTVKIQLKEPQVAFLRILADQHVCNIVNSELVKKHATEDDPYARDYLYDHAPGTGPFKLKKWKHNQFIALERNDDYWKSTPKIESIIFHIIPEPETASLMLRKGELDIVQHLPTRITNFVASKENIKVVEQPSLTYTQFIFNHQKPPLDSKKVRKAISYAVDYESIMKNIVSDKGIRMKGMLLKGMPGYDPERFGYHQNLEKARRLLEEAGYQGGLELKLRYPQWGNLPRIAVLLKQNLSRVGVNVKLAEMSFGPYLEVVKKGEVSIFPWEGSPAYNEPIGFLYPKLHSSKIGQGSGGNVARYSNPKLDEMLEEAMKEIDPQKRKETYKEIDRIVTEDAYAIFLYQNVIRRAVRKKVKNYTPSVLQGPDFSTVYIEDGSN